jgi:hypothetical protein
VQSLESQVLSGILYVFVVELVGGCGKKDVHFTDINPRKRSRRHGIGAGAGAGPGPGPGRKGDSMEFYFDHEKLEVYQIAIQRVAWSEILLEDYKGKAASA